LWRAVTLNNFHIRDDFKAGAPISQVPASWFNAVASFLNNLVGGYGIRVVKNQRGASTVEIDESYMHKKPDAETNFKVFETPSANDSTVSTGHSSNALLNTTWTRGDVDGNGKPIGVKVYLPTDSWGDGVSRSTAWRLCEFDHTGRIQKVYAQTIRTEAVNMDQINA
jgi:hypothetical protein